MKVTVKPRVRAIELGEYAPEYEGERIYILANPSREFRQRFVELSTKFSGLLDARNNQMAEVRKVGEARGLTEEQLAPALARVHEKHGRALSEAGDAVYAWFAELFSHGAEDTHWTAEEVQELVNASLASDPALWDWIQDQVWGYLSGRRQEHLKN